VPASSETATPLLDAVNTITAAAAATGPAISSSQREAVTLLAKLVKSLQSLLEARVLVSGVEHPTRLIIFTQKLIVDLICIGCIVTLLTADSVTRSRRSYSLASSSCTPSGE